MSNNALSEAETRRNSIDPALQRAGWPLDQAQDREYEVMGMPNEKGIGYADYVLWGDDGKPLAVVEAKRSHADPQKGQQQAKLYADCLERMYGQRPIIFYTNGDKIWLWDDTFYPPRQVAGFYTKDALARLILRRKEWQGQQSALDEALVKDAIVDRYYQKKAIGRIFEQFSQAHRKALLVMATGTGKTRTAIALVDALQRAGWVKRALFLADRIALVRQAWDDFKSHLPESNPVNLGREREGEGRVCLCTYPTMLGLINEKNEKEEGQARFGVGHFDLIIIDEAHRSVYQKYGEIFRYFDSLLVGLTATPRDEVDKNTYDLFELTPGEPTHVYELETAVQDDFLVPPHVQQVDLRFPREGIDYESLSEEEKAQWESLDWGDEAESEPLPTQVNASAINSWLFNQDTVDKVLQHLMEEGHKVEEGDRLAKTIIFARNHDHAAFIEQRFNHHYPHYAGHFARLIDHTVRYNQSLIEQFSQPDKAPHIAISVDMLDTGIDVPAVANLVFFKPVYSKIKFWQMIGRGTRLCPKLFGPEKDKQDFRIFDFCFNFDFFKEYPEGINSSDGPSLGTRLFRARLQLLGHMQQNATMDPALAPDATLKNSLADGLHSQVAGMNQENFIVRRHLTVVKRFQQRAHWEQLNEADRETLQRKVAELPTAVQSEDIQSRQFDLTLLQMQLAHAKGDIRAFDKGYQRVMEIASSLEEKRAIPAVAQQLVYLASLQEPVFWEGIDLAMLEEMRLRLRTLVRFMDKKARKIIYTDFEDQVLGVRETQVIYSPQMTNGQYEKRLHDYLQSHLDDPLIHRLRTHQPLTSTDLAAVEKMLTAIGGDEGERLLATLLERSDAPSLSHYILNHLGMERTAAQRAFASFLNDPSLTSAQHRFIDMLIEQLATRGILTASALYESPFTSLHAGGPEALFAGKKRVINGIFDILKGFETAISATL